MGGSMFVHTFGAYFGLALSKTLSGGPKNDDSRPLNSSTKTSDMFAMIGTLFLWMFWPSFNGALATQDQQVRVVVNTVLALTASCFAAFLWDATVRSGHKFDMETIQNATLAGGVAVGSSSDLVIQPYAAIIIGFVAGTVSVLGYVYVSPILQKHLGIDDTCGVHNLHGMPGIIGGIGGVLSALVASTNTYGNSIGTVFAARAACEEQPYGSVITPCGRTALEQANNQAYALIATVCISVFGGIITGLIVKIPYLNPGNGTHCQPFGKNGDERRWYNDKHYWEVPEEEHEHHD
jgi:ammonium transporter Rh